MADFHSRSYVQRRNLDDFSAEIFDSTTSCFRILFKIDIFYFRSFGQKVYLGKWHIPRYPNIARILPGL